MEFDDDDSSLDEEEEEIESPTKGMISQFL